MAEESRPSDEERRFLEILEQAALHDYPNPERKGCPGSDFLRTLAFNRKSIPVDDTRLDHLAKCSPCFQEFTAFRSQVKRRGAAAKRAGVLGIAAAAVLIPAVWFWTRPRQPGRAPQVVQTEGQITYAKAKIDLKNRSVARGAQKQSEALDDRLLLPRQRVDLAILLPLGAETGAYQIEILREVDQPLVTAAGNAERFNGDTVVQLRTDLSKLTPGKYLLGLRQPPWDWSYHPLTIQ